MEYVGTHVEIEVPDPSVNGYKVTDEQFDTLAQLIRINGDDKQDLMQVFKHERAAEDHRQYIR